MANRNTRNNDDVSAALRELAQGMTAMAQSLSDTRRHVGLKPFSEAEEDDKSQPVSSASRAKRIADIEPPRYEADTPEERPKRRQPRKPAVGDDMEDGRSETLEEDEDAVSEGDASTGDTGEDDGGIGDGDDELTLGREGQSAGGGLGELAASLAGQGGSDADMDTGERAKLELVRLIFDTPDARLPELTETPRLQVTPTTAVEALNEFVEARFAGERVLLSSIFIRRRDRRMKSVNRRSIFEALAFSRVEQDQLEDSADRALRLTEDE